MSEPVDDPLQRRWPSPDDPEEALELHAFETPRRLIIQRSTREGPETWVATLPEAFRRGFLNDPDEAPEDAPFPHASATLFPVEFSPQRWATVRDRASPLRTVSAAGWQELIGAMMQDLAPSDPGHGITLMVRHAEVFVYRNAEGVLDAVELAQRPTDTVNDYTIDEEGFASAATNYLERHLPDGGPGQRRFVFRTGLPASGADYVYLNLDTRRVLYLNRRKEIHSPKLSLLGAVDTVVVRSHMVAIARNPVSAGARLFFLLFTGLLHALARFAPRRVRAPEVLTRCDPMDLRDFAHRLDRMCRYPEYPTRLRLLLDGKEWFPRLIETVGACREQLLLRTYIFDNDDYALRVADALHAAADRGVDVRVLYDRLGSRMAWITPPGSHPPPDFLYPANLPARLRGDGRVRVREAFNPWFTSDHTKVTVADRNVAFLGGMNIGREYRYEWHDLMVELRGPIVGRLRKDTLQAWAHAGPFGDLGYAAVHLARGEQADPVEDGIPVRPIYTRTGRFEIFRTQRAAMRAARCRIFVQNPYFSDNRLLEELVRARRRGVDVRVILPGTGNHAVMNANHVIVANRLLEAGVRVFTYPGMTHLKAAVYDGWACVGSANFDRLSLALNQECNVGFDDPDAVEELVQRVFETDFARSVERTEPESVGWGHHLLTAVANWL